MSWLEMDYGCSEVRSVARLEMVVASEEMSLLEMDYGCSEVRSVASEEMSLLEMDYGCSEEMCLKQEKVEGLMVCLGTRSKQKEQAKSW